MTAAKVRAALGRLEHLVNLQSPDAQYIQRRVVTEATVELAALEEVAEAAKDYRANNGPDFTLKSCKHPYFCTCSIEALNAALAKVQP